MSTFALLFTLAAIGVAETRYLLQKRRAAEHPVCPIGGHCELVLNSDYNKTFGIHNDILGLGFYFTMLICTALIVLSIQPLMLWNQIVVLAVTGATLTSLYFLYLQARVIRAWCTWCILSATTIFLMAIILLTKGFLLIL